MKKYEKDFKVFENNTKPPSGDYVRKSWKGPFVTLYEVGYNNEIDERCECLENICECVFNYDNGSMKCKIIINVEDEGYRTDVWYQKEVFVTHQAAKDFIKNKEERIRNLQEEILKIKKELK
jgi:hypothetical protein